MTYWAELVELYEYRVADALEGRVPRGGKRSLTELRDLLLTAPLDHRLLRRLMETDRQYRRFLNPGRVPAPRPAPAPRTVPAWTALVSGNTPEARAWAELRALAWHAGLRERLLELTQQLQHEPERLTLRVLYAALENAERTARNVAQPLAVPAAGDPLVSLHDPEVVRDLALGLAALLLDEEGRVRLRSALSAVHDAPFPRHADADVLGARVEAAEREPLAPQARGALVQALRAPYPHPRDPRERPAIREAVRHLQDLLERLLVDAPAPAFGAVPPGSVLYAAHAPAALHAPDDGADELVIYLGGGQAARWRGLDFRWQPSGPNWQLQVDGRVVLLQPHLPPDARSLTVPTAQVPLHLFLSGDHLLLRSEHPPAERLGQLAARARAVTRLLDPEAHHANLRLARASAQHLRDGQVDGEAHGPASADKYLSTPSDTLLAFARRGVDALGARLAVLTPAEADTALRASAAVLGLSAERARSLHEVLHAATFTPETLPKPQAAARVEVPEGGAFVSVALADDPVTLQVAGRALTLRRDYKGDLAAVLPGLPAATLHDLLVLSVPGAHVLLIRHGTWLAAAVQPQNTPEHLPA